MSYVLRDYQQKASDAAVSFFNNKAKKTNAIMVLPTGSGKSLIIADIAARLDGHTLVFQPSKEILEQNFKKLCSYGILDCSIYSASFGRKEISRITFATIGSVINHPDLFSHFQSIIIDECHLVNPKEGMYKKFLELLKCKVLGLTATPYRLSSSQGFGSMLKFITRTLSGCIQGGYLSCTSIYFIGYGLSGKAKLLSNESDRVERAKLESEHYRR